MCDTFVVGCIVRPLETTWSDASTQFRCESDYIISLKLNVTFSGVIGYSVYSEYHSNYTKFIQECDNNKQLSINVYKDNLHVCQSCNEFVSDNSNEENKAVLAYTLPSNCKLFLFVAGIMFAFFYIV